MGTPIRVLLPRGGPALPSKPRRATRLKKPAGLMSLARAARWHRGSDGAFSSCVAGSPVSEAVQTLPLAYNNEAT